MPVPLLFETSPDLLQLGSVFAVMVSSSLYSGAMPRDMASARPAFERESVFAETTKKTSFEPALKLTAALPLLLASISSTLSVGGDPELNVPLITAHSAPPTMQ